MKTIEISLERAKQLYDAGFTDVALGAYSEDELLQKSLPTSWWDLQEITGWWIDDLSQICEAENLKTSDEDINIFPSKEYAEAVLALAQLLQLRKVYNKGWIQQYGFQNYGITNISGKLEKISITDANKILSFQFVDVRDEFFNNFQDLLTIALLLL